MKKYPWVLALLLSSLFVGSVAADSSHAQQDQAFLQQLSQQAQAPASPVPGEAPVFAAVHGSCIRLNCRVDSDCWPYCGGPDAVFCNSLHFCNPY